MDEIDNALVPIRKIQKKCQHPSWKCSLCNLYEDNIMDEQQKAIQKMTSQIALYESLLIKEGYCFEVKDCYDFNGIIIEVDMNEKIVYERRPAPDATQ